jgi:hypothetical protein
MGFDGPKGNEYHEVCVELEGPVDHKKFEAYKKKMKACLKQLRKLGLKVRVSPPRLWHDALAKPRKKSKK